MNNFTKPWFDQLSDYAVSIWKSCHLDSVSAPHECPQISAASSTMMARNDDRIIYRSSIF